MKRKHHIAEYIGKRLDEGHDILHIRHHLNKKGISVNEVNEAVDHLYKKLRKLGKRKKVFKPSFGKLIVPILVIVFILLTSIANFKLLPEIGSKSCQLEEDRINLDNIMTGSQVDIKPEITSLNNKLFNLQGNIVSKFNLIYFSNYPIVKSKVYKLNPFFPISCELSPEHNCRYFIEKEDYDCVKDKAGVVIYSQQDYNKMKILPLLIHTIFLFVMLYLVVCLLLFGYNELGLSKKVTLIIETGISIAIVIGIFIMVNLYIHLLRFIVA